MSFSVEKIKIRETLDDVAKGRIQLPEFQRNWVWDDGHIRSFIASISLSYPIGTIMLLEATNTPFKTRLFTEVDIEPHPNPHYLVLDGQQRLTAAYLSLKYKGAVPTRSEKNKYMKRYYFLDMKKCLNSSIDREDAVISTPDTWKIYDQVRKTELDFKKSENQYEEKIFPISLIFNQRERDDWEDGFREYHDHDKEQVNLLRAFRNEIIQTFREFEVPAIILKNSTPLEAVCQIFEKVNTNGVTLTVFELITAKFASNEFNLRIYWQKQKKYLEEKYDILSAVEGTNFLTAVTLLVNYNKNKKTKKPIGCKRHDVLNLSLDDFKNFSQPEKEGLGTIEEGFIRGSKILFEEKIFYEKDLPYNTQLIPLAAICAQLGKDVTQNHSKKQKILRWYWCGVLGEMYSGASETRFSTDIQEVVAWIEDSGPEPRTIREANFSPERLLSLRTRNAAAYKGLSVLLMQCGSKDFISGTPISINNYTADNVDIHHIFPKDWCDKHKKNKELCNCIVNKAQISSSTNRSIGGKAPSNYLNKIQELNNIEKRDLDSFLASHLIPVNEIRSNNFEAFIQKRASLLLDQIEKAMGKPVMGRDSEETIKIFGSAL